MGKFGEKTKKGSILYFCLSRRYLFALIKHPVLHSFAFILHKTCFRQCGVFVPQPCLKKKANAAEEFGLRREGICTPLGNSMCRFSRLPAVLGSTGFPLFPDAVHSPIAYMFFNTQRDVRCDLVIVHPNGLVPGIQWRKRNFKGGTLC